MTHSEMIKRHCPLTGDKCLGRDCAKCEGIYGLEECTEARVKVCSGSTGSATFFSYFCDGPKKEIGVNLFVVDCDNCEHQQIKCGL